MLRGLAGIESRRRAMNEPKADERAERAREIRRIFEDQGFELELLERWDGDDVEQLREVLTPEEFETLLDELQGSEERAS